MSERDLRVLIRGVQKWGDIRARYDPIVSVTESSQLRPGQRSKA